MLMLFVLATISVQNLMAMFMCKRPLHTQVKLDAHAADEVEVIACVGVDVSVHFVSTMNIMMTAKLELLTLRKRNDHAHVLLLIARRFAFGVHVDVYVVVENNMMSGTVYCVMVSINHSVNVLVWACMLMSICVRLLITNANYNESVNVNANANR